MGNTILGANSTSAEYEISNSAAFFAEGFMERTQGTPTNAKKQLYLFGLEEHVILVQTKQ